MPGMDGLELRAAIHAIDPEIPVVLITGHADVAMAVRALHDGAFDFLAKPFAADHLVGVVRRALAHRALILDNRRLTAAPPALDSPLLRATPAMFRLPATTAPLAPAPIPVLPHGDTW